MKTGVYSLIFFFFLIIGAFLRFYNLNFDNFWIDETITFWVSNPEFSLEESFIKHKSIEQAPYLFNLIIKFYFKIFGYDFNYSRVLPALFATFSIISVSHISKQISNNNSYLLTAALISLNIYLISYAQELRLYSTLFFLSSISIIFFIKLESKKNILFLILFYLFLLLTCIIHPFGLILYFSYLLTELKFFKRDNKDNYLKTVFYLSLAPIIFLYYFIQFNEQYLTPGWIENIDLKFFTNYYFSNFFGSRIVGIIYLIALLYFILKYFRSIFYNKNLFLIFSILILSYFLPLTYGLLFKPIIIPRYIIFVIIPIILLISHFIFQQKKIVKIFFIIFFVSITFLNLTTEQTFKQLYKERFSFKHDFEGAVENIYKSNNNSYSINIELKQKKLTKSWESSIQNYINFISKKNNYTLEYIPYSKNLSNVWLICVHDLNLNGCNQGTKVSIKNIKLNRIDITLIE